MQYQINQNQQWGQASTKTTIKYAGFWRRTVAVALDSLLFFIVTAPALYLIYGRDYFQWSMDNNGALHFYGVMDFLISKALAVILLVVFWHLISATPGKQLMHLKVVDAESFERISWIQALLRIIGYLISMLPLYLGFLWIIWDKRKQGFHDKIAKTVVIFEEDNYLDESLSQLVQNLEK